MKSWVLLSTAFRGGRQTSSGGAVIRHNRLIIPQVAKTPKSWCAFVFHVILDPEASSAGTHALCPPKEMLDKKFVHLLNPVANLP